MLRRDTKESYKSKGNALVRCWPQPTGRNGAGRRSLSVCSVYVEDATGERLWVDHLDCNGFVDNIVTAFGTK